MEISLFENKTVSLSRCKNEVDVTLRDGTFISRSGSKSATISVQVSAAMLEALQAGGLSPAASANLPSCLNVKLTIGFPEFPHPSGRTTTGYLNASIDNPQVFTSRGLASVGDNQMLVTVTFIKRSDQSCSGFIPVDTNYSFKLSRPQGRTRQRFEILLTDSSGAEWNPEDWRLSFYWSVVCSAKLTLAIHNQLGLGSSHPIDCLFPNRRMLTEELHCDVAVIAENKSEVKFHRSFLSAHSSVFNSMFQSDMTEARTGIVEMPDVTEEGVRALREYLYLGKLEGPIEKSEICCELLEVGHKYDIQALEKSIERILLQKPPEWYAVDVTLRLFLFVRGRGAEGLVMKKKAVQVLKAKYDELKALSSYKELCKTNTDAFEDLCDSLIKLSN